MPLEQADASTRRAAGLADRRTSSTSEIGPAADQGYGGSFAADDGVRPNSKQPSGADAETRSNANGGLSKPPSQRSGAASTEGTDLSRLDDVELMARQKHFELQSGAAIAALTAPSAPSTRPADVIGQSHSCRSRSASAASGGGGGGCGRTSSSLRGGPLSRERASRPPSTSSRGASPSLSLSPRLCSASTSSAAEGSCGGRVGRGCLGKAAAELRDKTTTRPDPEINLRPPGRHSHVVDITSAETAQSHAADI